MEKLISFRKCTCRFWLGANPIELKNLKTNYTFNLAYTCMNFTTISLTAASADPATFKCTKGNIKNKKHKLSGKWNSFELVTIYYFGHFSCNLKHLKHFAQNVSINEKVRILLTCNIWDATVHRSIYLTYLYLNILYFNITYCTLTYLYFKYLYT